MPSNWAIEVGRGHKQGGQEQTKIWRQTPNGEKCTQILPAAAIQKELVPDCCSIIRAI